MHDFVFSARRSTLMATLALAGAVSCGPREKAPAVPTLYGGISVTRAGKPVTAADGAGLSLVISDVPICTTTTPTEDFFLITTTLVSYGADGKPVAGPPAASDFRISTADIAEGRPGSWAVAQVDVFGDPRGCGAWDCNPKATGATGYGGFVRLGTLEGASGDPNAMSVDLSLINAKFDTPAYTGPPNATATLIAPCALSLLP